MHFDAVYRLFCPSEESPRRQTRSLPISADNETLEVPLGNRLYKEQN